MTGNIVPNPPRGITCIECEHCGSLYTTDEPKRFGFCKDYYEKCPVCGHDMNNEYQKISLAKYKVLRWWRELSRGGEPR